MNKFLQVALLSGSLGMITPVMGANQAPVINVQVNNRLVNFEDALPINDQGTVYVPLRGVLQAMGTAVQYNPVTHNIKLDYRQKSIEMKVGSNYAYVNGRELRLNKPLPVAQGRVLIPLRFVAETFGANVNWNGARHLVEIHEGNAPNGSSNSGIRAGKIEVRTTVSKSTFHRGETVRFTVTAINTDDRPRSLTLPSGKNFDITVTPVGKSTPQWKWSHGKMFTMMVRDVELNPGQKLTFTTDWNQKDNDGQMMPRGEVKVQAILASMNSGIKAQVLKLHLVE